MNKRLIALMLLAAALFVFVAIWIAFRGWKFQSALVVLSVFASLLLLTVAVWIGTWAWRLSAREDETSKTRANLLAALDAGLILAVVVALLGGLLNSGVQNALQRASDESQWRDRISTSSELAGPDLLGHDLRRVSFSGKVLLAADLKGANLRGVEFVGATLKGVDLRRAQLQGADFIGADLTRSDLRGANLDGALLESANLGFTDVEKASSLSNAETNFNTCWPRGFLETPLASKLKPQGISNLAQGQIPPGKGREADDHGDC
jgi:hypothetical protein